MFVSETVFYERLRILVRNLGAKNIVAVTRIYHEDKPYQWIRKRSYYILKETGANILVLEKMEFFDSEVYLAFDLQIQTRYWNQQLFFENESFKGMHP